jgi:anti-sigma factor RsiW
MTCDQVKQSVQALLDGELSPEEQHAVEAHAATCVACRTLIADLEAIRATAVVLERRKPSPDVWARIALQVTREPAFQKATQQRLAQPVTSPTRWNWPVLAMAATLLIALIAGSLWILDRSRAMPGSGSGTVPTGTATGNPPGNAATGALVETIEHELDQAASHYEKAIAGLEQIANASDSPLDPDQMTTVKQNLAVIDRAIDESRTALRAQPTNQLAQESLFEAFRRKVSLLQDTIALMNEMRKGNQAGAARIAEGQNKS